MSLILPILFSGVPGADSALVETATPFEDRLSLADWVQAAELQEPPTAGAGAPGSDDSDLGRTPLPVHHECAWQWPDGSISGWYAGLGVGLAYTRSIDDGISDRLTRFGFSNADVDYASSAMAGKLFVGYRFERPFSVEAGWMHLGRVDGDFTVPPPPPGVAGTFEQDTTGFFASAAWHFHETELWSFSAKAGGLEWDTDTKISLAGLPPGQRNSSDDGIDPFFGLTAMRSVNDRVGARMEVERFFLDSDPIDHLSVGLFVKF